MKDFINFIEFLVTTAGNRKISWPDRAFAHFVLFCFTIVAACLLAAVAYMSHSLIGWIIIMSVIGLGVLIVLNRLLWLGLVTGMNKVVHGLAAIKNFEAKLEGTK